MIIIRGRDLDLMGKNLNKVMAMVNKINTRRGKDKTLGSLSKFSILLTLFLSLLHLCRNKKDDTWASKESLWVQITTK
jgi:hypothetical protein